MILNWVVSWTSEGIEHEADQRHSEILVGDMGLQGSQGISTPSVTWTHAEVKQIELEEVCEAGLPSTGHEW